MPTLDEMASAAGYPHPLEGSLVRFGLLSDRPTYVCRKAFVDDDRRRVVEVSPAPPELRAADPAITWGDDADRWICPEDRIRSIKVTKGEVEEMHIFTSGCSPALVFTPAPSVPSA